MIDLFSGTGGASEAMIRAGWDVTRVDNQMHHYGIRADVMTWEWTGGPVDLLWASPPCTEFSREAQPWCRTGNTPSLALWNRTLELVGKIRPRFWVIENVVGAQRWVGRAPAHYGPIYLWGWYPKFRCEVLPFKEKLSSRRRAKRGKIPFALSQSLASAVSSRVTA